MRFSVVGLGPSGTAASAAALRSGYSAECWDPHGPYCPPTMGAWAHQIPQWLRHHPHPYLSRSWPRVWGDDWEAVLPETYVILNPDALRDQLWNAGDTQSVSIHDEWYASRHDDADVVIDTRASSGGFVPVRQLAVGLVLPERLLPHHHRRPVLMDMRTLPDSASSSRPTPDDGASTTAHPGVDVPSRMTFNYRMPLGPGQWLIEETIVATLCRGPEHSPHSETAQLEYLRWALDRRLEQLGINPEIARRHAVREEVVSFPVAPLHRRIPHVARRNNGVTSIFPWGAAAGLMHAATGYSIGSAVDRADKEIGWAAHWAGYPSLLQLIVGAVHGPPGGWIAGWLQRRGLGATLQLNSEEMRLFYREFFAMSPPRIRDYLTSSHGLDIARSMVSVVARLVRVMIKPDGHSRQERKAKRALARRTFMSLLRGSATPLPRR
ncbi:lycopene cyclase family protein [uncultured Corynebacterium sp.]|uniref:lycopene cyclase family protein n=1 Tax=uncultured Corynebacterium sp. TaxID=159447 RepID=UPI0025FE3978|nr:lycopene cyclase family protein [uncultured Corynebacterium sp.]